MFVDEEYEVVAVGGAVPYRGIASDFAVGVEEHASVSFDSLGGQVGGAVVVDSTDFGIGFVCAVPDDAVCGAAVAVEAAIGLSASPRPVPSQPWSRSSFARLVSFSFRSSLRSTRFAFFSHSARVASDDE
mgnify:CR=1 FL=1